MQDWVSNCESMPTGSFHEQALNRLRERIAQRRSQPATPGEGPPAPPSLDDYEFLELIDQGGMGAVWRARQIRPIQRTVAVKLVRAGLNQHNQRLRQESQALAVMAHPNIARIFEAGETRDGRPCFVMEFVEGQDICSYAESGSLSLARRLELFAVVCRAIQHCHVRGVIHRDIKPSNVLVTRPDTGTTGAPSEPLVKVIDFGLAKTNQDWTGPRTREETAERTVLGSPFWMSPEQARGAVTGNRIDHRTDIYSLGALLYQLVTGTPPLDPREWESRTDLEIMNAIQKVETEKPGRRIRRRAGTTAATPANHPLSSRSISPDLDQVVLKALQKEPRQRYQTAAEFAEDISRLLDHRPVHARPPSVVYRSRKWLVRNRVPVITALALALCVIPLSISSLNQSGLAERAKRNSQQASLTAAWKTREADEASHAAQVVAEKNRALEKDLDWLNQQYLASLDRMSPFSEHYSPLNKQPDHLAEVSERLLSGRLSPERRLTLANKIARIRADYEQWELARQILVDGGPLKEVNDRLQVFRAECLLAVCEIELGDVSNGLALYRRAISEYEESENPSREALTDQKAILANEYYHAGYANNSLHLAREVLADIENHDLPDSKGKLNTLLVLTRVYNRLGLNEKAIASCEQAMQIELEDISNDAIRIHCGINMLDIYNNSGQANKARALAGDLLEISLKRFGPDHRRTLELRKYKCVTALLAGETTKALEDLREVYDDCLTKLGEEDPLPLRIAADLTLFYHRDRKFYQAVKLYEATVEQRVRQFGETHPTNIRAVNTYGYSLIGMGKFEQGLAEWSRVLKAVIHQNELPSLIVQDTLQKYTSFGMLQGKSQDAVDLVQAYVRYSGGENPDESQLVFNLGCRRMEALLSLRLGDFDRGEKICKAIIETPGFEQTGIRGVYSLLAEILIAAGRPGEAADFVNSEIDVTSIDPALVQIPITARILRAEIQLNRGEPDEALASLETADNMIARWLGANHLLSHHAAITRGEILRRSGKLDEAERCFLKSYRAQTWPNQQRRVYDWRAALICQRLETLYREKGDADQAEFWQEAARQWAAVRENLAAGGYFNR